MAYIANETEWLEERSNNDLFDAKLALTTKTRLAYSLCIKTLARGPKALRNWIVEKVQKSMDFSLAAT